MAVGETVVGTLWTSFAGICIEKLLDELLKVNQHLFLAKILIGKIFQNGINQKKSASKESQDASQTSASPTTPSAMLNSSDSLLYNFSYLSSVIHPVIILRLLEHRLFTPLFKKKSVTSNASAFSNPFSNNDTKNPTISLTPHIGASALASIPMLPKLDPVKRQRSSLSKDNTTNDRASLLTKFTHSTYDKHRKTTKNAVSNTSISAVSSGNSQISTTSNLPVSSTPSSVGPNSNELSLLLAATIAPPPSTNLTATTNNSNQSRKWFWRSSDKNLQSHLPNDRNPLLQAIVESDTSTSKTNALPSASNPAANGAVVGEIKLLEKELLNLPSFQLSDSQNPLLPSPTCLGYGFPTPFDQPNSLNNRPISMASNIKGQQINNITNGAFKSRIADEDCT